jgi:hypothetical protein
MTNLEHKFYLADLERSARNPVSLPRPPSALIVILVLAGLSAIMGAAVLA